MSHPRQAVYHRPKSSPCFLSAALCLLFMATGALAQSTEIDFPTPVRAGEINGVILPRDVGDPRPTRHFYSLTGTPGDLVITVESKNLDGDVDLFTAGTLRPLAKISLYAGEAATSAAKSIYLRRREALVLRIEARSPDENQGGYRIRFEGAFEPILGEVATAPEANAPANAGGRAGEQKTKRVTSVGARIEEPPAPAVETAKAAEPTPTPSPQPSETARTEPADATATTESKPNTPAPRPKPTARNTRTGRPARTRPARVPRSTPPTEKPNTAPVEPVQAEAEPKPATTPVTPPASPRLIIETRDGMKVERFMNTVRRVTVEGGQVVVITKDGKVERQPLTNILRMSIEQ